MGVGFGLLVLFIVLLYRIRFLRAAHPNPRYIPTAYLKNKWREWRPSNVYDRVDKSRSPSTARDSTQLRPTPSTSYAPSASTQIATSSTDVDRRQSVRSIMTLPPYRIAPLPSEQLIAREGERAGVDTVIEFPSTEAELEEQRDSEMEALYNIRQARRREQAEREERRRQRREAREQGDWARLEILEQESRARARARAASNASMLTAGSEGGSAASSRTNLSAAIQSDSAFLIAELNAQREVGTRSRRVSSVSYADLGLARHDGSRIRADSMESDNRPLLDSAASMGGSRAVSRQSSPGRSIVTSRARHVRNASEISVVTVDSDVGAPTPRTGTETRSGSDENGVGLTPSSSAEAGLPSEEPPSYDHDIELHGGEAPPYESPVRGRGERVDLPEATERGRQMERPGEVPAETVPTTEPVSFVQQSPTTSRPGEGSRDVPQLRTSLLRRLPAIEVLSATPVNSVPTTPIEGFSTN